MTPSFVIVDLEGNGASPPEIVEISVAELGEDLTILENRHWLLKPSTPIQWRAKRVHGISNEDVENALPIASVRDEIASALTGRVIVAHNAPSDLAVLCRQLPGWLPAGVIDTLALARKLLLPAPGYTLAALVEWLKLDIGSSAAGAAHRTAYDTTATAALFRHLAEVAQRKGLPLRALVSAHRT